MRKSGNGKPAQCIYNLMRIIKGTIPYAREKGISRGIIDRPVTLGANTYLAELAQNAETYEPRAELDMTAVLHSLSEGTVRIDAAVKEVNES